MKLPETDCITGAWLVLDRGVEVELSITDLPSHVRWIIANFMNETSFSFEEAVIFFLTLGGTTL